MSQASGQKELTSALSAMKGAIVPLSLISGVVNVLALTGSFYMLQVYDRVLTSHSVPTLIALSVLVAGLYVFLGTLDVLRAQALVRIGARFDERMSATAHAAAIRLPLFGASNTDALHTVRDVDSIRSFLSSQGPVAILDMPWTPVYLAFVTLLHPLLGAVAMGGLVILIVLTWLTERRTAPLNQSAQAAAAQRMALLDQHARNSEVLKAMGLGPLAAQRFREASARNLASQVAASDTSVSLSGISRTFRLMLQSAMLGLGAFLTLKGQVSAGAIIAGSIAASRALAPVELAIGHWRGFVAARQAWKRLVKTLSALPPEPDVLALPPPRQRLEVENVTVPVPGTQRAILSGISFALEAGHGLGIIGPSAAGKSTLGRALTGVWPLARGAVRLDGAAIDRWPTADLGNHIGYLPQDVALLDGTIAENIARLARVPDSARVLAAAEAAGVHEMILRLPEGYETALGPRGTALSAGQRQRIALARALYGDPFLVVLDEPNSNLDADGDAALTRAIQGIRSRGGIVVVIAHRASALAGVDMIASLSEGRLTAFGPKDEVLKKVLRPQVATVA